MISTHSRMLAIAAFALAGSLTGAAAQISTAPQPGASPQAQVCQRLEQQLSTLERGDPARAEQTRRYEEAAERQQAELDRTLAQARRIGCENAGFFNLFGGGNPQCGPLNSRISEMRTNLNRITGDLQRLQGAGVDYERDGQRRAILAALGRNDCGPQYRAASQSPQGRGLFESLFGNNSVFSQQGAGNTYRTICVRTCDGFFYPISFATTPNRFGEDERTCHRMCPATEVVLFTHRNPGEDVSQAVSTGGRLYTELPNAFRYRQEFNAACSCKKQGETWAEALKGLDNRGTIEQGDIVVTEDRAKQLSAPRDAQGRPVRPAAAVRGKPDPKAPEPEATPAKTEGATADASAPKPAIRTVGPQLGPVR